MYLDEIQDQLFSKCGTSVLIATLVNTLCHLYYSCKVISARAMERDNLLQSTFMNRIADKVTNPDMLMFVRQLTTRGCQQEQKGGHQWEGDVCRGDALAVDNDFQFSLS